MGPGSDLQHTARGESGLLPSRGRSSRAGLVVGLVAARLALDGDAQHRSAGGARDEAGAAAWPSTCRRRTEPITPTR